METRAFRKHALAPKPQARKRFIPTLPDWDLAFLIGKLAPDERQCLARIVETADVVHTEAGDFLLVPAPGDLIDTLAAFNAEAEDRENDLEDERDEGKEDDSDSDNAIEATKDADGLWFIQDDREPEALGEAAARAKVAEGRRVPIPENWGQLRYPRRDFRKECEERKKVDRFLYGRPNSKEA